jgi:methylmalonyl-CoA/ethylmalonyl-CoA epimerase
LGKSNEFNPTHMRKIEHIGIAVKNLDESNKLFARLLGVPHYKIEAVESEGVRTSFFQIGDVKIELLEATRVDSPIARFIEKRGEGIHHLAFDVADAQETINQLSDEFHPMNATTKPGADNKMIAFLHPKATNGVLVEVCSERDQN